MLYFNSGHGGTASSPTGFPTGQWMHLAYVRAGATVKIAVNGVFSAQTINAGAQSMYSSISSASLGSLHGYGAYLNGYVDEFRVTKGVARWTSNFTPPTASESLNLPPPSGSGSSSSSP